MDVLNATETVRKPHGKNILIVSQVIPQWYVNTLKSALGEEAHIDIITGSKITGANIIPSPLHDARSFKSRIVCWLKHFAFMRRWMRQNRHQHYDLIFAISNPPINSLIGLTLKRRFHAPFVYMNWDLYPQVIEYGVDGFVSKTLCKLWHKWNNRNYPKIDRMLTIGEVMATTINRALSSGISMEVFPIAVDTERLRPIAKKDNPFAIEYGLTDKFVILYSGKMGMGHNIEMILEASTLLSNTPDIRFVFIGNGPKYPIVQRYITEHHSENILLLPLQPEEVFPYSMACGDVGIVSQEAKMAQLFMPSKAYSMMACGEAIIGIGSDHDDLGAMIKKYKVGVNISSSDPRDLANRIEQLHGDSQLLENYKTNARATAGNHYSIEVLQQQYDQLFKALLYVKD
jgi:glycosyltransferase involved in cell wall biosynthesis